MVDPDFSQPFDANLNGSEAPSRKRDSASSEPDFSQPFTVEAPVKREMLPVPQSNFSSLPSAPS